MKIAMVGSGYVGLVSGACFADFGHDVVCIDKDASKIERLREGIMPIYEPGLDALVDSNARAGRLTFTTDLAEGIEGAGAIFIAVGTPSRRGDGHADLSFVHAVAREVGESLVNDAVVVTKSTVPVGTGDEVERILLESAAVRDRGLKVAVVSNPEFLREGAAIGDFKRPDRIVIGAEDDFGRDVMREVYRPLFLNESPILFVGRRTSELIKYAANAFLATKITFINEIADLCEKVGANVQDVARGIGMDNRIGSKFLHAGPGYGGSCFPKDTKALARIGQDHASPVSIVETVIKVNEETKRRMIDKLLDLCGGSFNGKRVAVLGVTFKPNTDDMRDAPALTIVPALVGGGAQVSVVDPQGRREGEALLPGVRWEDDPYAATAGADLLLILTEWNEFRALDLGRIAGSMATARLADLRNIYSASDAEAAGFVAYDSIGRTGYGL